MPLEKYVYNETRYTMLAKSDPEARAASCWSWRRRTSTRRWKLYEQLARHAGNGRRSGDETIDRSKTMIDLSTTYLGLKLKNPLVASASPLCEDVDNIRRMEDAGAAAVVLHSLFEEQIDARERRARPLPHRTAPRASPRR